MKTTSVFSARLFAIRMRRGKQDFYLRLAEGDPGYYWTEKGHADFFGIAADAAKVRDEVFGEFANFYNGTPVFVVEVKL